jgi:voltage-gated potassium channel
VFFILLRTIFGSRKRRVTILGVSALFIVITLSSLGFWYLESEQNLSFADSIWLSFVTMTTVGYGDIYPKSFGGRVFTIFVPMICGIGVMAYLVTLIATSVIEKEARLVNGQLELHCKNHIIIVNCPNEWKIHAILDELRVDNKSTEIPIVLISDELEQCPDQLLKRKNFFYIKGNPTISHVLERANAVEALQAVILAKDPRDINSDGLTTQVALILEQMHRKHGNKIYTVAEVISQDSVEPLQVAGVEHVICLENVLPPLLAQALRDQREA